MASLRRSGLSIFAVGLAIGGCAGSVGSDGTSDTDAISTGTIVRAVSNKCLDIKDHGTSDGSRLQQWSCSGGPNQTFRLDDAGGVQVHVVNPVSNKCLDVAGAGTANGTSVQLFTCNGSVAQAWVIESVSTTGYSQLRNPHSNRCLDVSAASSADGANVQIYDCNSSSAQQWRFTTSDSTGGGSGGTGGGAGSGGSYANFVHPGVLVDQGQLDFVKAKIAAKQQPWLNAYNAANGSWMASLGYTPHPRADVQCGPTSNPDIGCTDEKNDSAAAYTHALLWYYSGNSAHAETAIRIMNAWASTITQHELSNAPLESAWTGSLWPRAGEIIKYTYGNWKAADQQAFANMLKNVYLPEVVNGSGSNGNWEASMIEATMGIAVFLDDHATFNKAVAMWKKRTPAYIYMSSDGAKPIPAPQGMPNWYGAKVYSDGLCQETCRDLGHVQYGIAALTNAAETARIQGVDLFSLEAKRLAAGYEFHARFLNGSVGNTSSICGVNLNAVSADPMWEIAHNALVNRLGMSLPQTTKLVQQRRPSGADHHMQWETLTHGDVGNAGIQ